FAEEATPALMRWRWPGNVRELRNLCERMAVLCPNEIVGIVDLPAECRGVTSGIKAPGSVMIAAPADSAELRKHDSVMIPMPADSGEVAQPVDSAMIVRKE